jgi:GNAT superfamily N-acetyltransferase
MTEVRVAVSSQDGVKIADSASEVEIRYLADTPEVTPLLAQWHYEQWRHLPGARTIEQRIKRLQAHLQRDTIPTTFVAWIAGKPVGNASLIANEIEALSEWIPWLANVYVLPDYRRRGIGTQLVERVAAETVALGYPRLYLYTMDQTHFYEALGWRLSHMRRLRGHDMSVMARDLIVRPPLAARQTLAATPPLRRR